MAEALLLDQISVDESLGQINSELIALAEALVDDQIGVSTSSLGAAYSDTSPNVGNRLDKAVFHSLVLCYCSPRLIVSTQVVLYEDASTPRERAL